MLPRRTRRIRDLTVIGLFIAYVVHFQSRSWSRSDFRDLDFALYFAIIIDVRVNYNLHSATCEVTSKIYASPWVDMAINSCNLYLITHTHTHIRVVVLYWRVSQGVDTRHKTKAY